MMVSFFHNSEFKRRNSLSSISRPYIDSDVIRHKGHGNRGNCCYHMCDSSCIRVTESEQRYFLPVRQLDPLRSERSRRKHLGRTYHGGRADLHLRSCRFGATAKNGMEKFAGFFIGLALTMVHFVGIALTGTSVNPVRFIDSISSSPRHSATFGFHRCTYHRWNPRLGRLEESPL